MNEHEKINYIEFPSSDLQRTKAFFTEMSGWLFQDFGHEYIAFNDQGITGGFFKSDLCSSTGNGAALTVFYSQDLEATQDKIVKAGARL